MLLWALLAVLVAVLVARRVVQRVRFVQKASLLPCPRTYPIIGNANLFLVPHNRLIQRIAEIIKQNVHPFVIWAGPVPTLVVTKPQHMEVILSSSKLITKSYAYQFLEPWLGTGLLTSTGSKWHSHRKMITPTFHFKILDNFVEVFSEKSEILVDKLRQEVDGPGFDVVPYITRCTLDIICETAMGIEIKAQDQEVDSQYARAAQSMGRLNTARISRPWLYPQFLYHLTADYRQMQTNLAVLHGFTNKVIRERKESYRQGHQLTGGRSKKAFLDLLLHASETETKLTDEELREEVDTFMFEGHDTTTAALVWALYLLGAHPDVQDTAYEEQKSVLGDPDKAPTMSDLSDMKYLERVIKEALRLYPSVPAIGREITEDTDVDGYTVPAGCVTMQMMYFTHRDPEHWDDPEKFDPDRFLPERVAKRHPYAYIPFSAGPRNCIGQKFALLEEKTVLSYVLRHYRVKSLCDRPTPMPEMVLRPEGGVRVALTRRGE